MEVNGAPKQPGYKLSSKYVPLCSAEQRNSYRIGTTWGWVNDDRIFIFGWTIPLSLLVFQRQKIQDIFDIDHVIVCTGGKLFYLKSYWIHQVLFLSALVLLSVDQAIYDKPNTKIFWNHKTFLFNTFCNEKNIAFWLYKTTVLTV